MTEKQHRIEHVEHHLIDRTQTLLKTVKSHPDHTIKVKALDGLFLIYGDPDESESKLAIHLDEISLQQIINERILAFFTEPTCLNPVQRILLS